MPNPIEALLKNLDATAQRYHDRQAPREEAAAAIDNGDFIGANKVEDVRARMNHIGVAPEITERVGTLAFQTLERPSPGAPLAMIENVALERILADNDLMPVSFLALGQLRARSIGRIHVKGPGNMRLGFGTGFLVSPNLLMTNNHVLENAVDANFSEVEFDFELDLAGNVRQSMFFRFDPAAFFATDKALDFTLVAVSPAANREPREWGWLSLSEKDGLVVKGEYVSIIQHPNGEAKQLAMRENRVIDLLDNFAHYHTDTAPGSSGSPVFNDQWEVVALHHSGVPDRLDNGEIKAVDGTAWKPAMGDHRIKWIANEGVFGNKIAAFIKNISGLSTVQKQLRDEFFGGPSPMPTNIFNQFVNPNNQPAEIQPRVSPSQPVTSSLTSTTFTIPLQVTLSLGGSLQTTPTVSVSPNTKGPTAIPDAAAGAALQQSLAEADAARNRPYYSKTQDEQDVQTYYQSLAIDSLGKRELYNALSALLKSTHTKPRSYQPSQHLYPWVDLHPDKKLRSIYSGKTFDAEEFIREDFRIEQERAAMLQELLRRESNFTTEQMSAEISFLEAQNPYNCEHVVPQSWFAKKEPMRGDLHHLFACESGCNNFRGNIAYFDFSDFDEAERTSCGKRVSNKFEPSAGKGSVARATLYFLLRYPGLINDPTELPRDRLSAILQWHHDDPVTDYEKHRNQVIYGMQGNRNPLIDFPELAGKVAFEAGLG